MTTMLFHETIFGPIKSRRLGVSLGVNLLPTDGKLCSFNCIYCECGLNEDGRTKSKLPTIDQVEYDLNLKLKSMQENNESLDVITFAGNGEPTLHPDFEKIIDITIIARDKYYPEAKISVLSNGMHVDKESIFRALKKVDNNILKLDAAIDATAKLMDQPNASSYSISKQVELFRKFDGNFILQTMFLRGNVNGIDIDNTTDSEITAWLAILEDLKPKEVMIYTIDRETPLKSLKKVSIEELNSIGDKVKQLGLKVNIAG